jgi:hypothetical protein
VILALAARDQVSDAAISFFALAGVALFLFLLAAAILGMHYFALIVAPEATRRISRTLATRNFASFVLGLPLLGLGGAAVAILIQAAPAAGAVVLAGLLLTTLFGTACASEDLGRRLFYACGGVGNRATHMLVGWAVCCVGSLMPIVGWCLVLPYVLSSGVGSIVLTMLGGRRADRVGPGA